MEIILLENVRNLGKFGKQVRVANGYGRNFLIPQGKAVPATKINIAQFESQREKLEQAANQRLTSAQERAAEISNVNLNIKARAADEGKLYGSVGTHEIVAAFAEKGVKVERQEIRLPNGVIREIGSFEVDLQLHAEVVATVKLTIEVAEK
jgi:large subunit ribosomal protein L9